MIFHTAELASSLAMWTKEQESKHATLKNDVTTSLHKQFSQHKDQQQQEHDAAIKHLTSSFVCVDDHRRQYQRILALLFAPYYSDFQAIMLTIQTKQLRDLILMAYDLHLLMMLSGSCITKETRGGPVRKGEEQDRI